MLFALRLCFCHCCIQHQALDWAASACIPRAFNAMFLEQGERSGAARLMRLLRTCFARACAARGFRPCRVSGLCRFVHMARACIVSRARRLKGHRPVLAHFCSRIRVRIRGPYPLILSLQTCVAAIFFWNSTVSGWATGKAAAS